MKEGKSNDVPSNSSVKQRPRLSRNEEGRKEMVGWEPPWETRVITKDIQD